MCIFGQNKSSMALRKTSKCQNIQPLTFNVSISSIMCWKLAHFGSFCTNQVYSMMLFHIVLSLLWHQGRHPSAKIYIPWPLIHPSATICAGNWLILAHFSLMKYTVWCCFRLFFMSDLKTEIICCFYMIVCINVAWIYHRYQLLICIGEY